MFVFFFIQLEVIYDEDDIRRMVNYDKKLQSFYEDLITKIKTLSSQNVLSTNDNALSILPEIERVQNEIIEGIYNDLNLRSGFKAIWNLINDFHFEKQYNLCDLIIMKSVFGKWLNTMGLTIRKQLIDDDSSLTNYNEEIITNLLVNFRHDVRENALKSLHELKQQRSGTKNDNDHLKEIITSLLSACDQLRTDLNHYGIKLKVSQNLFLCHSKFFNRNSCSIFIFCIFLLFIGSINQLIY